MTCWRGVVWHVDREPYYHNRLTAKVTWDRPVTLPESKPEPKPEPETEAAGVAIKCACGTHRAQRGKACGGGASWHGPLRIRTRARALSAT